MFPIKNLPTNKHGIPVQHSKPNRQCLVITGEGTAKEKKIFKDPFELEKHLRRFPNQYAYHCNLGHTHVATRKNGREPAIVSLTEQLKRKNKNATVA